MLLALVLLCVCVLGLGDAVHTQKKGERGGGGSDRVLPFFFARPLPGVVTQPHAQKHAAAGWRCPTLTHAKKVVGNEGALT